MIRYALNCDRAHVFESWFQNSAAYDKQAKRSLVTCPVCGSAKIEKAIMAPSVSASAADDEIAAAGLPLPQQGPLQGYHRRLQGQRLDLIANFYTRDATAFWRLCDANGSVVPDALASHDLIAIPVKVS